VIIRMLGPTIGETVALSSYLVNGVVLVDCGGAGFCGDVARQAGVRDVFLTHSHLDHVASLPILLDNVYGVGVPPTLHVMDATLERLQRDLFNDATWPDVFALSKRIAPFLHVRPLTPGAVVEASGLRVTAVHVDHTVPAVAFILEEPGTAVAVITDTAPTDAIWERLAATPDVRAVFLECSFPEELADVAAGSKHMTPTLFAAQAARRPPRAQLYAIHLKPQYHRRIVEQLKSFCPDAEIARPETDYTFAAS
jgi:ribonuclease BN (tRNA processing enzyme)